METEVQDQLDQAIFRDVIGRFMSGVTVITTRRGAERFGVTVSAVTSLSMDPPMLLICLNRRLAAAEAIGEVGVFAVNILGQRHAALATQFATRHPDKFRDVALIEGKSGVPIIADAFAWLECRVLQRVDVATHAVFMAEVQTARGNEGSPLAYFRGKFGHFTKSLDDGFSKYLTPLGECW
jgi:flavin reductase (DIM6/NTAB) family NADH-FMN oxidoreductase RutF